MFNKKFLSSGLFLIFILGFISCTPNNNTVNFSLQQRDPGSNKIITKDETINPGKTAIIVIDMWNDHRCISAAGRVAEMAPAVNNTLKAARHKGIFIIHAPSGSMDFYQDTPQRRLAIDAPFAEVQIEFKWNYFNGEREGYLEPKLEEAGCSCDTPEPCPEAVSTKEREIETLEIEPEDAVSDNGQEIYNLLQQRNIDTVIIMGVHTNRCVLGRPFGIRQMAYVGKNVILCRDLTDSYHRDPGKHFEGLAKIIEHVEKYWCPTITSDRISGDKPFKFKGDNTI